MPMRPCSKCLENQWKFSFDDATRIVTATCKYCDSEVSFPAKSKHSRPIDPKKLVPVSMHHAYVPGGRPVDRPDCAPWD